MITGGAVDRTMIASGRPPSLIWTSLIWQVSLLETGGARAQLHAANALASLGFQNIDNQRQMSMLLVSLLGTGGVEGAVTGTEATARAGRSTEAKSNAAAALWRLVRENPNSIEEVRSPLMSTDCVTDWRLVRENPNSIEEVCARGL
jgi:hypothetical protein